MHVNTPTTNSWSLVDLDNVWTDSSNNVGDRLLAFTLRTFATPAALFEVGLDAAVNTPYRMFSGGHRGGELLAQGVLDAQRGDTLGAIETFSQGSGELLLAFDDGLAVAAPLAGYLGKGATTVVKTAGQTDARAVGMRVKTCLQAGCGGPGGTASTALDTVTSTAGEAAGGATRALPSALRGGEATTQVYFGVRNGERVYVGITNDIARRQAEHGGRFVLERITQSPVTRGEARAIEQALINRNPGFENIRNSISQNHSWYGEAIEWGEAWLRAAGY